MLMPEPSTEKCSGSPLAMVRSMVTPTMRCSTSVTERSGSLPMSSATMESTISSEFCLIFWAELSAARLPETTTVSIWASGLGSGLGAGAGAVWAKAMPAARPPRRTAACAAATDTAVRWRLLMMSPVC